MPSHRNGWHSTAARRFSKSVLFGFVPENKSTLGGHIRQPPQWWTLFCLISFFFICLIVCECVCVYVNACLRDGNSLFLVPCAFPLIRDQQHRRVRSLDFWPPRWSLLSHYYFYDYYYCYYYHYSIWKHNKEKMKIIIHFRHLDSRDTAVMLQTRGHECVNEHEKTVSRPGRCDCLPKK